MAKMKEKTKSARKDFIFELEIPAEITAEVKGNAVIMKKDSKELVRIVDDMIETSKEGNKIVLSVKKSTKRERKDFGTAKSHLKNMVKGLMEGYEYELEICNVHFPMTVSFDKAKSDFIVKNILGEKAPRVIKVSPKVEVEIKAPRIKIKSYDLEAAGQAAANLEKLTKIRNRDRNKFQDGIFIIKKPGVEYL